MIRKQATRKPDVKEEKPRNRNPANPRAIEMSDCTQNALVVVHVSLPFSIFTNAVPAEFADSSMYAKTCNKYLHILSTFLRLGNKY